MFKTIAVIAAGVIATLMIGNVVEVSWHPEHVVEIPGNIAVLVTDSRLLGANGSKLTEFKRRAEQLLVHDKDRQLEIALLYVKTDANTLQQLLAKKDTVDPKQITAAAELLEKSITRLQEISGQVSPEKLAQFQRQSSEVLAAAGQAITSLQTNPQLTWLVQSIAEKIAELKPAGEVAGSHNVEPTPNPSAVETIPLKF